MSFRGHGILAKSWWAAAVPPLTVSLGALSWVGIGFQVAGAGRLFGLRAYYSNPDQTPTVGIVWDTASHLPIAAGLFWQGAAPATGWLQCWLRPTRRLVTSHSYRMAVLMPTRYFRSTTAIPGGGVTQNGITLIESFQSTSISPAFNPPTANANRNGVDILFQAD